MKLFGHLSFICAAALAGFLTMQATPAKAAEAISIPALQSTVLSVTAPSQVVQAAYYYYHGRRYPYRYHNMYFNNRYYRGGRYHYY